MRLTCSLLVILLALSVPALFARAEEGEVEVPEYSAEDMVFQEGDLPEGWSACPQDAEIPPGAPTEAALMQMGEAIGLDEDTLYVESRAIRKGEAIAVVSLIDIDTNPEAFRKLLEAKKADSGWQMVDLGSPMRPLVVSAPDAETAQTILAWQREAAVRRLADTARTRLQEQSMEGAHAAQRLLNAGSAIEPKAGVIAAVGGFLQQDQGRRLGMWAHAIAPDTPIQPKGEMRVQLAVAVGVALYRAGDEYAERALAALEAAAATLATLEGPARPRMGSEIGSKILTYAGEGAIPSEPTIPIALEALKDAVAHESALDVKGKTEDAMTAFGNRYNLSCTYARLGQLDPAFEELEQSLKIAKAGLPAEEYAFHYEHAKSKDPDMSPLREDERFAQVMETYAPGAGTGG